MLSPLANSGFIQIVAEKQTLCSPCEGTEMRFAELHPAMRYVDGITWLEFDCPACTKRVFIQVSEKPAAHPVWHYSGQLNLGSGENYWDTFTVTPSINFNNFPHGKKGPQQCWHGNITNGQTLP